MAPSRYRLWLWISAIELVFVLLAARELSRGPDGKAHLKVLDIGQGDSLLLVSPSGKQIVIDGGPDSTVIRRLGEEMPFLDRTIELLVLTHPDADHVGGLPEILRRYRVEHVLLTGISKDTARYREFLSMVRAEHTDVIPADPATDIDMGDGLVLDVLWPPTDYPEKPDVNDSSIVIRAIHGARSALLTGDVEAPSELAILRSGADIDADILKVGHHGSRTSTGTGFLLAVSPDVALISVGAVNSYGHPSPSVIERLAHYGIPTHLTSVEGTVEVAF